MSERRHITRTTRGLPTQDGAGVSLTRLIGTTELPDIDPILMLDNFGSEDPKAYIAGFPSHPHRGFETVSYMIAGSLKHKDNIGGEGLITDGGVQWMTAGRGVVHSEMPTQTSGLMFGFQLWLNLPAAEKMSPPWYQDIPAARIPHFDVDYKASAKLIAGTWGERSGPGPARATNPFIADVVLNAGGSATIPVPHGHAGFIYVFQGEAKLGPVDAAQLLSKGQLGVMSDGETIEASARNGARLLIVAGKPLREPIAKHGPFVMNTMDELRQAVSDYQRGQF